MPFREKNRSIGLRHRIAALILLFPTAMASAQVAEQITDLRRAETPFAHSNADEFLQVGNRVVFLAQSPSVGLELWSSDGTESGTQMLADTCPGLCGAEPMSLTKVGDSVFWLSSWRMAFTNEKALWTSDGTQAGTRLLLAPISIPSGSQEQLEIVGDSIVFSQRDSQERWSLWKTDGSVEGTLEISDLAGRSNAGQPRAYVLLEDRLFFFHGEVIWSTNGTESGTRQELDLRGTTHPSEVFWKAGEDLLFVGSNSDDDVVLWSFRPSTGALTPTKIFPSESFESFQCAGTTDSDQEHVYFSARDNEGALELWRTDGTSPSTLRLVVFERPNPSVFCPTSSNLQTFGDTVIFPFRISGQLSLFRSVGDMTIEPLTQICEGVGFCGQDGFLTRVGNKVLFTAFHPQAGREVWTTDGSVEGTELLKDLCPGPCGGPEIPARVDNEILFFAQNGAKVELWRTDATEPGTEKIADLDSTPAVRFGSPSIARLADQFFFLGEDPFYGFEPRVADETTSGSRLLADIFSGDEGSGPANLLPLANGIAFKAGTSAESEPLPVTQNLWFSGGSKGSNVPLTDFSAFSDFVRISQSAGMVFFTRENPNDDLEIWRSDGSARGTLALRTFEVTDTDFFAELYEAVELRAESYFLVSTEQEGGLYTTNGSPEGTVAVALFSDLGLESASGLWEAGGLLYFKGNRAGFDSQLFVSDGSASGTQAIGPLNAFSSPRGFVTLDGNTFFLDGNCPDGLQLFRTDGTAQGTAVTANSSRFGCFHISENMVTFGNALYFLEEGIGTQGGVSGTFLWRYDGSEEGTTPVARFEPSLTFPSPQNLTVTNFGLAFTPNDPTVGQELWVSDGTSAGTRLLKNIRPGNIPSRIHDLVSAGDKIYFAANDGVHGSELWISDGTEAGTRLMHDIYPGGQSSDPQGLAVIGNQLYFSADDGISGRELWALPLDTAAPPCRTSNTALCLQEERFKVEIQWKDFQDRIGVGNAVPLTEDTGYFWFFDEQNVETILKVLDGQPINEHFWTFYGALSNVEYRLTVTDGETGLSRRYLNPMRRFGSVGDTEAFGPRGASLEQATQASESSLAPKPLVITGQLPEAALGEGCTPSEARLCLNEGRFAVEATWADFSGNTGIGQAVNLTDDTGYFWFFNDQNVETVLKVLDGRASNNAYWVFYGSLSNVDFDLTVTDTQTGAVRTYQNRDRQFASVGDTEAFPQP